MILNPLCHYFENGLVSHGKALAIVIGLLPLSGIIHANTIPGWECKVYSEKGTKVVLDSKIYTSKWYAGKEDCPNAPISADNNPWTPGEDPGAGEINPDDNPTDCESVCDKPPAPITVNFSQLIKDREAAFTEAADPKLTAAIEAMQTLSNRDVENIAPGSQKNPANVQRVEKFITTEKEWAELFPNRNPSYTYVNFLKAVGKFPAFCGTRGAALEADQDANCGKSLAVMFAHFAQETNFLGTDAPDRWKGALYWKHEMNCTENMICGQTPAAGVSRL